MSAARLSVGPSVNPKDQAAILALAPKPDADLQRRTVWMLGIDEPTASSFGEDPKPGDVVVRDEYLFAATWWLFRKVNGKWSNISGFFDID